MVVGGIMMSVRLVNSLLSYGNEFYRMNRGDRSQFCAKVGEEIISNIPRKICRKLQKQVRYLTYIFQRLSVVMKLGFISIIESGKKNH